MLLIDFNKVGAMKKLITIAMTFIAILTVAQANEQVLDELNTLPRIFDHKLVVKHGPQLAAVQPTAHVEFTFGSCRRFDFSAIRHNNSTSRNNPI